MDFLDETPETAQAQNSTEITNIITPQPDPAPLKKDGTRKKDGRGRPPKDNNPKFEKKGAASDEDKLRNKLADFQQNATPETNTGKSPEQIQAEVQISMPAITGRMMLELIDFIAPRAIIFIYQFFDDNARYLEVEDIKLSALQKSEMLETADQVAKLVFAEMSPLTAFSIMIGISYFNNVDEAMHKANKKAIAEKERKEKEREKKRPKLDISPDE